MADSIYDLCDKWLPNLLEREYVDFPWIAMENRDNYNEIKRVVDQLVQDGYAFSTHNSERYQINAQGERFAQQGGYKHLNAEQERLNAIKERVDDSVIKTNESVLKTNQFIRKTNRISLAVAITALFVAGLPFLIPNPEKNELKVLNQKLDSISVSLHKIASDITNLHLK